MTMHAYLDSQGVTTAWMDAREVLVVELFSELHGVAAAFEGGADAVLRQELRGCGKLYRARFRLYRNEILQVNMRLKALNEIYTMHSFGKL